MTKEKAEELAPKIETLIMFAAQLVPDIDDLKAFSKDASDRHGTTMAMAPIIMACGEDYDGKEAKNRMLARRSRALYEFVLELSESELEYQKELQRAETLAENRAFIRNIIG